MLLRFALACAGLLLAEAAQSQVRSLVVVAAQSPWTLRELESTGFELVSYDPDTGETYLIVNRQEEQQLLDLGHSVSTVEPDLGAGLRRLQEIPALGLYHTVAETVAELESLHATHPALTMLEVIGQSLEGRPIHALKISDDPDSEDAEEPDVLFVGNHHAREFMTVEVPLWLARELLQGYSRDTRVRQLVNTREVWIVPLLNPDGHVHQENTQLRPGWRKNRRVEAGEVVGVDLNRNYSYRFGHDEEGSSSESLNEFYRGTGAFSEPESDALRRLVERQRFTIAISYHSYGQLVLYPWGWTRGEVTRDHALYATLADSMVRDNGYRPGNASTGAIYLTNGVWDDFMYGETSTAKPEPTFAFTVELNSMAQGGFWPEEDLIEPTCRAMWSLNLYVLSIADDVRGVALPLPPVLSALQNTEDPRQVHLNWNGPGPAEVAVDFYEVFEIAALAGVLALASSTKVRLDVRGEALLAGGMRLPSHGIVSLRLRAALAPPWDRMSVVVREQGRPEWTPLVPAGPNAPRRAALADGAVRRSDWLASPWAGKTVDLALRLETDRDAPRRAWIEAGLDLPAMLEETRRVLAVVEDTTYTVMAERPGLFAYGVTAVSPSGQRTDSDIYWFVIPERVAIDLQDLAVDTEDGRVHLRGHLAASEPAEFEAWSRPLAPEEFPRDARAEWGSLAYRKVASTAVRGPGAWEMVFAPEAARIAVLLRVQQGDEVALRGPWVSAIPQRVALLPAVPNPFNPQTRLRFDHDGSGAVRLEIVRPDGKRIRRLLDVAALDSGRHETVWDGLDERGRRVAAGVYIARLQGGSVTLSRRLVLLP